ncbi:MotA/TolQ/ExbB proton channel family protein [Plebeiibacterium marinum]|uniref:MotA/TolQ/ExbB proton channel family protein n=1 Tax=Plebeiibacterium marinum TaxID=2992111 RepID=A0AAE3SKM6_9BACT|nr:MotA/TolQ/ExbB proton channel family protein [Plebeiobacterium marinum]MCW3807020.1 MotA/TolQ/ExbB proton channel family protein [Plebeiobacterium marinum]
MSALFDKFNDGGPIFSYPIMIMLLIVVFLIVKGFIQGNNNGKTIALLKSVGWFALAWGFLGRTFGLIVAFDNVASRGELTPSLLAEGLKMAILGPLFAIIVFIIARAGVIFFLSMHKKGDFHPDGKLKTDL